MNHIKPFDTYEQAHFYAMQQSTRMEIMSNGSKFFVVTLREASMLACGGFQYARANPDGKTDNN